MNEIRTERSFGVTSHLQPIQRMRLHAIRNSDGWPDVLDVMEMCCIEIDTILINTPAEDETAVLANHKFTKAAWIIFEQFQKKIDIEISQHLTAIQKQPPVPPLTPEEMFVEHTLDPTKEQPPDDYMGI
jgi:hypothetical protein